MVAAIQSDEVAQPQFESNAELIWRPDSPFGRTAPKVAHADDKVANIGLTVLPAENRRRLEHIGGQRRVVELAFAHCPSAVFIQQRGPHGQEPGSDFGYRQPICPDTLPICPGASTDEPTSAIARCSRCRPGGYGRGSCPARSASHRQRLSGRPLCRTV